jgi:hypothetical protein
MGELERLGAGSQFREHCAAGKRCDEGRRQRMMYMFGAIPTKDYFSQHLSLTFPETLNPTP